MGGAIMIISFVSMLFLGLPTLTFFYAKQMGRNPKKWFITSFFTRNCNNYTFVFTLFV